MQQVFECRLRPLLLETLRSAATSLRELPLLRNSSTGFTPELGGYGLR